jgi:hypothetical protein
MKTDKLKQFNKKAIIASFVCLTALTAGKIARTENNNTIESTEVRVLYSCKQNHSPSEALANVGVPPLFDSSELPNMNARVLKNLEIVSAANIGRSQRFIFWENEDRSPNVIGIAWFKDIPQVFKATILDPL